MEALAIANAEASQFFFHFLYLSLKFADLIGRLGLGHTDYMDSGLHDSLDILASVRSAERIDTDNHFRVAEIN